MSVCGFSSDGSAVDGSSVVVDLGNVAAAFVHTLDDHSGTSGSDDWQASSHSGIVDGLRIVT